VVGVVEQNLNVELVENVLGNSLDGGNGANGHEDRGADLSVRGDEASGAGGTAGGFEPEMKKT